MGKPTGFMEYRRLERPEREILERVKDFEPFRGSLSEAQRREQGARCMNCGVPFCQSEFGCPLHNLIPEWNDEVYGGNWSHALARLLKINEFPEFTGRVCPALCETACTCSLHDSPVSVRDNELAIIEYAYEHGLIPLRIPPVRTGKRVAVVGSGPAGLAAAERLNQRGHEVTVYERDDRPGGLLMYGIPNMKLEKPVVERRIRRMEREQIRFVTGREIGKDIPGEELLRAYDAVILCCGARRPREVPMENAALPGVWQALDYLTGSTRHLLDGAENPADAAGKDVIIIGNGDTATDCLATAIRQGAKSVTQLVRRPAPPEGLTRVWPHRYEGLKVEYGQKEAIALFGHDPRLFSASVKRLIAGEDGRLAAAEILREGKKEILPAGLLLLAAGFAGAENSIADAFGLTLNEKGRAAVGPESFQTENPKLFAAGDLRNGATLVATAIADGRACAKAVDLFLEGYTYL